MTSITTKRLPERVVILALDTFGDLILRQPLFAALLDREWEVTVVVRTGYEAIVPYLDRRLQTIVIDIAPHDLPEAPAWRELAAAVVEIGARRPDLLVAAAYNRTYAEEWILHQFPGCETAGLAGPDLPLSRLDALPAAIEPPGLRRATLFTRSVECAPAAHEIDKARALFRAVTGEDLGERRPRLRLDEAAHGRAATVLERLGLLPRQFVFGCPGGTRTVALKAWAAEDFVELALHVHTHHHLPILLAGSAAETPLLHEIQRAAERRGLRLPLWAGQPDDLSTLLGLVAQSRLYLGNDTGPMHMAGALDVPVVARFGGGHWPRFVPVARRSFTATQRLPCFGCAWQCYRDEPACLTRIEPQTFVEGIDWALASDVPERWVEVGRPATEPWPARLEVRTPPRVCVVTPSFNQGRFLRETIESVLAQSYPHVEYVVADGGSTDESVAILRSYGDRIRWTSGPDDGQAAVIAQAWRQTNADVVAWLNSDDTYLPDAIATAVDHLVTHPDAAMVYGQAWYTNAEGERLAPYPTKPFDRDALAGECFICQPAAFVRRRAFETVEPPDPGLQYCMDYDLWIRLSARFRIDYVRRFLATSRIHAATKTSSQTDGMLREILRVVRGHYGAVHRNWIGEYAKHALARALDGEAVSQRVQDRIFAVMEDLAQGDVEMFLHRDRWAGRRTVVTVESDPDGRAYLECECPQWLHRLRVRAVCHGRVVATHVVRHAGRFVLALELPPQARPRAQVVLEASHTFIPVLRGLNADSRSLSFVVVGQTARPAGGAEPAERPPLVVSAGAPHASPVAT